MLQLQGMHCRYDLDMQSAKLVDTISEQLEHLTPSQLSWVQAVVQQFKLPHTFLRNPKSDIVDAAVLEGLGDALRIHHAFSRQALSKDRFEFALERTLHLAGRSASLAVSRTNRGHDITIDGVRVSLKTQADAGIKADLLHISKFMELGRGEWVLTRLRDLFLEHMQNYERVFQFRCLQQINNHYRYELVEIPMSLLNEASNADLVVAEDSKQNPKPGYGYVKFPDGSLKYALYFDGGTERKLQVKNIRKDLCTVHATWEFDSASLA
jgi:Type II site-specific deoxyribonuclease